MNDTKSILASKTFWGAIVMLAATVSMFFKVDLGDQNAWAEAIVSVAGGVIAIIGRVKAVKKIG